MRTGAQYKHCRPAACSDHCSIALQLQSLPTRCPGLLNCISAAIRDIKSRSGSAAPVLQVFQKNLQRFPASCREVSGNACKTGQSGIGVVGEGSFEKMKMTFSKLLNFVVLLVRLSVWLLSCPHNAASPSQTFLQFPQFLGSRSRLFRQFLRSSADARYRVSRQPHHHHQHLGFTVRLVPSQ